MITLADIKKSLPFKISIGISDASIRDYCENHWNDVLDFDVYLPSIKKNLQRPLVWTLEQKQELILSVFKDVYIPPICVIKHKPTTGVDPKTGKDYIVTVQIIDGKQRLSAMLGFYKNEFPIVVKGVEYYFKDLSLELQQLYARYDILHNVAYSYDYSVAAKITDESKIAWFEMINFAGTAQEIEHLNSLKK